MKQRPNVKNKNAKTGSGKGRVYFLSFIIPIAIMLLAYSIVQFYPVGDRSPLTIDLYHQYVAFLSEFKRKIEASASLFYSWSIGLGTNFYALLAYYAASPMNWLLVFFPMSHITEAVTFLTVTKLGFAGLFFAILLKNELCPQGLYTIRDEEDLTRLGKEGHGTDAWIVTFSVAYALCAFQLAFSWDIMWLDVTAMLPLVILGLNRLIKEGRSGLYIFSLAFCLLANYYIAFFVCFFVALYFFVAFITARAGEEEMLKRRRSRVVTRSDRLTLEEGFYLKDLKIRFWPVAIRFAVMTLIAAAVSMILLLPTAISLADTSAAGDKFPTSWSFRFSLFDFMTHQLATMSPSIRDGLPNVYNGILALIFLPLYIFSDRIPMKEKLAHLSLLAFLFLSFNANGLDFIWHGLHYPNQLPYRYSFLFSFLLILMCFRTVTVIRQYSAKTLMTTASLGLFFVILAEKLSPDLLGHGMAYVNMFFFLIYIFLFSFIWKKDYFRTVSLLFAVVMIGEIAINTFLVVGHIAQDEVYTSRSNFISQFDDMDKLIDLAKDQEQGDFFRMEAIPAKTTNDGALFGYPGFTLFSSTSREDTAKFMRFMAFHGNNINSYKYVESTPIGDSLFGLKYLVYKEGQTRDVLLEEVGKSGDMTLYRNPYALEIGAVADPEFAKWQPQFTNPFKNWNHMLKKMAGLENVFVPVDPVVVEGSNFKPSSGDGESGLRFSPEQNDKATLMRLEVPVDQSQYVFLAVNVSKDTTVKIKTKKVGQDLEENYEATNPTGASDTAKDPSGTVELTQNRSIHWIETFNLGYCEAGDIIDVSFEQKQDKASDVTVYASTLSLDSYKAAMAELHSRAIDVTEWHESSLKGQYEAKKDGMLYLSVPYDSSWQVKIDGEKVETASVGKGALLAVPTTAGSHTLEMHFIPKGFWPGLGLSLLGILLWIILIPREKALVMAYRKKAAEKRYQKRLAKALAKQKKGA
jgi:uncharacterized membrane protein YfhO